MMSAKRTKAEMLSEANHTFTCNLYKQVLQENPENNLFFSPFSVYTALSMTLLGARSETASQILKCLHLQEEILSDLHTTLDSINSLEPIDIANALFIQKSFEAMPSFVGGLEKSYKASVRKVDFSNEPDQTVLSINTWVNDSTRGKISKLIDSVEKDTVLMILNAVYFKSFWARKFVIENTSEEDFYLHENNTVKVKLMYQSGQFRLSHNKIANCDVLELPYQDKLMSMLILLPKEIEGLQKIEMALNADFLNSVLNSLGNSRNVDVYLPTFKLEQSLSLHSILSKMGMSNIFCPGKADLTGISEDSTLYVSKVVHKSFIEIDEQGTEAAAVTGVMVANYCARFNPVFRADHPFMFCIIENNSKHVIFVGSMRNPPSA